jgi:ABC-2 type transport system permease protein
LLFSIVFRSAATAALVTLGLWLFLSVIWPPLAKMVATIVAPPDALYTSLGLQSPQTFLWEQALLRISPSVLYAESASVVLDPSARILGLVEPSQLQGLVRGAPLPIEESLVMIWPQIIGLVAGTIVLFVIGYIVFQRQEVRA